jgi:hypothetical protein
VAVPEAVSPWKFCMTFLLTHYQRYIPDHHSILFLSFLPIVGGENILPIMLKQNQKDRDGLKQVVE